MVATSVNYLAGSDEAPAGFPGTAHAMEHMMFRGSPGLTADQLADIGSIVGGDFNANTREGLTQYLFTVPAEDLDIALNIEALRMRAVLATQGVGARARRDRAGGRAGPVGAWLQAVRKAARRMFAGTPYAHDALGTRPSFDKTTAQMLKSFHDTWYAPNNAILVIAGNVDPEATLSEVRRLFGAIPAKRLPAEAAREAAAGAADSFTVDTDQPAGTLMLATRTPGPRDADYPALEVLADVLSSKRFALYGLVPQGKATAAEFALDPLPEAGLAYAALSFNSGDDPRALEARCAGSSTDVARDGVPEELVAAAKLQERSEAQFQRNSIPGLASIWADALALYGLNSPDEDLERIEKVTVADVNRVARKYLDLDHAIVGIMQPRGSGQPVAARGGFGGQEQIALGEAHPTQLPPWAEKALRRLEVPPSTLHPLVSTLPNGLTLIVQTEDVSDTVSVYGHVRNRPEVQEARGEEGVAPVLDRLLGYGSEKLDRLAFQQQLDAIGARVKAGTDFSAQSLSEHFDRATQLLADNELHPALPDAALQVIRNQTRPGWPRAIPARGSSRSTRCAAPCTPRRPEPAHVDARERRARSPPGGAWLLPARIPARHGDDRGDRQDQPRGGARDHREILRCLARGRPAPQIDLPLAPANAVAPSRCRMPAACRTG